MSPLIFILGGVAALLIARATTTNPDPITRRTYRKRYSDAPGADTENKPDTA
jgi:hypothetical protein